MGDTNPRKWFRHYPEHLALQTPDETEHKAYVAQLNLTVFTGDEAEDASGPQVHAILLGADDVELLTRGLRPFEASPSFLDKVRAALDFHLELAKPLKLKGRSTPDFAHTIKRLLRQYEEGV